MFCLYGLGGRAAYYVYFKTFVNDFCADKI